MRPPPFSLCGTGRLTGTWSTVCKDSSTQAHHSMQQGCAKQERYVCLGPILHHTLTANLVQVAAHLAQHPNIINAVYASDLLRAQQTMQAIVQALPSTVQVRDVMRQ